MKTKLSSEMFAGKTIAHTTIRGVNCLGLSFTDGTSLEVEVEAIKPGLYGMVAETNNTPHRYRPYDVDDQECTVCGHLASNPPTRCVSKTRKFLVRQNCEFSLLVDALDETEACRIARETDYGDIGWDKAWSELEVEEHDG